MKAVLPSAFAAAFSIGAVTLVLLVAVAGNEAKVESTKAGDDNKPESKKI